MPKTISSGLATDLASEVGTFATCVEITREDGKVYRLTSHDVPLTIDGNIYGNTNPFQLSQISSSVQLNTDNCDISLVTDESTMFRNDFRTRLFDRAAVTIFQVNYENLTHGKIILKRGWFGTIDANTLNDIKCVVVGLSKAIDSTVGRVYAPGCSADLGDGRCKFAVNRSQKYSVDNYYKNGDWVYKYDESRMTGVYGTNLDFAAAVGANVLPGWTILASSHLRTASGGPGGAFVVSGDTASSPTTPTGFEHGAYQDISLLSNGYSAGQIDSGLFSWRISVKVLQSTTLAGTPIKIQAQVLNAAGVVIDTHTTGWVFTANSAYHEKSLAFPIIAGARTIRVQLSLLQTEAQLNASFYGLTISGWDHVNNDPFHGVVYKAERIVGYALKDRWKPSNAGFNKGTFAGWSAGGDFIVSNIFDFFSIISGNRPPNDFAIAAAHAGTISKTINLITGPKLSAADIDAGRMIGYLSIDTYQKQTSFNQYPAFTYTITFKNASGGTISTTILSPGTSFPYPFAIPANTRSAVAAFSIVTPSGSVRNGAIKNIGFYFYDKTKPTKDDPTEAFPVGNAVFPTTVGATVIDGAITWIAAASTVLYDTVTTAVDNRTFNAAALPARDGYYQTAEIKWLSGANAGQKNIIRTWDAGTKRAKLYNESKFPISIGDRFLVVSPCQKRFFDCKNKFNNAVNFRGFPYVPSKVVDDAVTPNKKKVVKTTGTVASPPKIPLPARNPLVRGHTLTVLKP